MIENKHSEDSFDEKINELEREINHEQHEIDHEKEELKYEEKELGHLKKDLDELRDEHNGKKKITIFVNGIPEEVEKKEMITYKEVVTFAFPDFPQHPERTYSVKYKRGHSEKPEGILPVGGEVKVKDQMSFDVTPTGQS